MQQGHAEAQKAAVRPDTSSHASRGRAESTAPEHLTDHFNRAAADPRDAERVRLAAIRERTAAVLIQETGGLAGTADAWIDRPQLTCLVQDVWLKLERGGHWESRAHFLGAVARAARQVLIDQARKRQRRHASMPMGHLDNQDGHADRARLTDGQAHHLLAVERLLHELAAEGSPGCERAARVAGLRLFGGLPSDIIARTEGVSTRTVERDWLYARAWLASALKREGVAPAGEP
jgi:RNA polymerase sigma factor (TIGR02999 family)